MATTPSPNEIRMKQPKNSAHSSPIVPCRQCSGNGRTALDSATVDTQPPPLRRWVQDKPPTLAQSPPPFSEEGAVPARGRDRAHRPVASPAPAVKLRLRSCLR